MPPSPSDFKPGDRVRFRDSAKEWVGRYPEVYIVERVTTEYVYLPPRKDHRSVGGTGMVETGGFYSDSLELVMEDETSTEGEEMSVHRCSRCGKPGHKRPTCPERSASSPARAETLEFVIPEKPEKSKTDSTWILLGKVLPHCRTVLLYGPPGTGKTTAGNAAGNPETVFNITLTEETPAAELRGHYVPKGTEFLWQDGPALSAYRHGARLVLNEIDKASGDALTFCHALLDDPGISAITLPTGETVKPAEGFTVVATTNGEPDDLPEALRDRFQIKVLVKKPHPAAIESLPEDLREAALNSVVEAGDGAVTFRTWKSYALLRDSVGEKDAAKAVFGDRAKIILDTLKISRL